MSSLIITIERCEVIPLQAVDTDLYDDPEASLAAVLNATVSPSKNILAEINSIAKEMPLLWDKTFFYAELSRDLLSDLKISPKDLNAIDKSFFEHRAFVIPSNPPILFISQDYFFSNEISEIRKVIHHEMVHVEQVIRGDSRWTEEGQYWKDEFHNKNSLYDLNQAIAYGDPNALYSYLCLPWEEEAFCRSEGNDKYKKMRMNAAIKSMFFNLKKACLVEVDSISTEDYRVEFLLMCGDAIHISNEKMKIPDVSKLVFNAYDDFLKTCHIKLGLSEVSALRFLVHKAITLEDCNVPFDIESDAREVSINIYLSCFLRIKGKDI